MMKKRWLTHEDVRSQVLTLARQVEASGWRPDYIVGLTRGGLLPAVMLSHWFDVPLYALKVSLRDGKDDDCDHNAWMAEDAFGYTWDDDLRGKSNPENRKRILIVDDINDSGATIAWIKKDWKSSCLPADQAWDDIFGANVRFAVLVNNISSNESISYQAMEINKAEDDQWIVFPWEDWWTVPTSV